MNRKNERVAVIGGGLSGLVIAEGLQRKGYEHVTLFEKTVRVGGKLHTIWCKGKSYEFGALFGLPDQKYLKKLMKEFQIKIDGPQISRVNYDAEGHRMMQIPKEDLGDFIEELDRLPDVLAKYQSLEETNIHHMEDALMLPFSEWCALHRFRVLEAVYAHYFTSYGLGDVGTMPALYVLRILNYDNLMSFMDFPKFCTWKNGVSMLTDRLRQRIQDVRLGQAVTGLFLSKNGEIAVHTELEVLNFDRVVIASPLNQFAGFYKDDPEMKRFLNGIQYQDYNVYAFIAEKVPQKCGCVLENLSPERKGHVIIWHSRWDAADGEELVMVYAYENPERSKEESFRMIKEDLVRLGICNPRLYQFRKWKQCPHVDTGLLQKGFYEKMEAMQGKYNIFLAGEIMSTVSMDNCIRYSEYFVERFF